jgi:SAM-dependent methyltransferase
MSPAAEQRSGPDAQGRRWKLTAEERERIDAPPGRRGLARAFLRAHLRSPRLVAQTARSAARGAVQGVRGDQSLPWILHDEHARSISPDVGSHVTGHGLDVFVDALGPRLAPGARVLDLGCGGGRVARLVAGQVGELVCADVSEVMLAEARRALTGRSNVSFVRTHGLELEDMAGESFDVVYAHDVFVTFDPNPLLALLDEGRRVLRPGGTLVASFYTIDRPAWARAQLSIVRRGRRWGDFGASYPRPYTSGQIDALFEAVGMTVADRRYGAHDDGSSSRAHYVVAGERSA